MFTHAKGKYTRMSKRRPRAIGVCDYSGLEVRHSDMVRQFRYAGQGLVDTGMLVNPKFKDKPNPQDLTIIVKIDPAPILNARPDTLLYESFSLVNCTPFASSPIAQGSLPNLTLPLPNAGCILSSTNGWISYQINDPKKVISFVGLMGLSSNSNPYPYTYRFDISFGYTLTSSPGINWMPIVSLLPNILDPTQINFYAIKEISPLFIMDSLGINPTTVSSYYVMISAEKNVIALNTMNFYALNGEEYKPRKKDKDEV